MGNQRFEEKKDRILRQLSTPADDYKDASPKGSVDEPIRGLVGDINRIGALCTTSSCSGRISVYVDGANILSQPTKSLPSGETAVNSANSTGKGGGRWAFVSHEPLSNQNSAATQSFHKLFGLHIQSKAQTGESRSSHILVHLKFEPMVRACRFEYVVAYN